MLEYQVVDSCLRALAEPTRRSIVERLGHGPASVSEVAEPFDLTLAAVAQHLQVLETSGLIRTEKLGRVRTCRIDPAGLDPLVAWIAARRATIERQVDRLGEVVIDRDDSR